MAKSKEIIVPIVPQPLPPVEGTPENPPVINQEAQPNTEVIHHDEPTQTEEPEATATDANVVESEPETTAPDAAATESTFVAGSQDVTEPAEAVACPISTYTGTQIVSLSPATIKRNTWSRVTYLKNVEGGVEVTHQDELHSDDDSISISNVRTYIDKNARIIMSEEIGYRLETAHE